MIAARYFPLTNERKLRKGQRVEWIKPALPGIAGQGVGTIERIWLCLDCEVVEVVPDVRVTNTPFDYVSVFLGMPGHDVKQVSL